MPVEHKIWHRFIPQILYAGLLLAGCGSNISPPPPREPYKLAQMGQGQDLELVDPRLQGQITDYLPFTSKRRIREIKFKFNSKYAGVRYQKNCRWNGGLLY